ncbi:MAG: ABC transporter permease [Fimbriimonadales bacterium]|nr:ABC transporter permease [Fimbriimonadales bacterium]
MTDSMLWVLLVGTVTLASPLILAAMGGYVSERGGIVNIALEGKMLAACAATSLVGFATRNAWLALGCGAAAAVLLAWTHWLLTQRFRVDAVVSGMALNALAFGATNFFDKRFTDPTHIGDMPRLPLGAYQALAFLLPLALAYAVGRTRAGVRLLASGSDPDKARQMGVEPIVVRFWAQTVTGVFCGVAGAMIVTNAGRFVDNMTAGRGFIALAALILGGWRPIPVALACLFFGFAEALQLVLQGTDLLGAKIPVEFWQSLPYLATILALAGFAGKSRAPAGLGKV